MGKIALENYRVFNLKIDNSATTQPVKTYRTFPGYSQYRNFDFFLFQSHAFIDLHTDYGKIFHEKLKVGISNFNACPSAHISS